MAHSLFIPPRDGVNPRRLIKALSLLGLDPQKRESATKPTEHTALLEVTVSKSFSEFRYPVLKQRVLKESSVATEHRGYDHATGRER